MNSEQYLDYNMVFVSTPSSLRVCCVGSASLLSAGVPVSQSCIKWIKDSTHKLHVIIIQKQKVCL